VKEGRLQLGGVGDWTGLYSGVNGADRTEKGRDGFEGVGGKGDAGGSKAANLLLLN